MAPMLLALPTVGSNDRHSELARARDLLGAGQGGCHVRKRHLLRIGKMCHYTQIVANGMPERAILTLLSQTRRTGYKHALPLRQA